MVLTGHALYAGPGSIALPQSLIRRRYGHSAASYASGPAVMASSASRRDNHADKMSQKALSFSWSDVDRITFRMRRLTVLLDSAARRRPSTATVFRNSL